MSNCQLIQCQAGSLICMRPAEEAKCIRERNRRDHTKKIFGRMRHLEFIVSTKPDLERGMKLKLKYPVTLSMKREH